MAFTVDDFQKIWASTSPLTPYEFSESNYKEGWNFIGGTPPSRQMWDFLQKKNDEKTKFLYELAQMIVPVGVVQAFAGDTTPEGWLLCDGSAVSRTDYADLYAVIGDTYGAGDGSTTFNLPDLIDKFVQGNSVAGTEHSAGLPNITGSFTFAINNMACSSQVFDGSVFSTSYVAPNVGASGAGTVVSANRAITMDLSAGNPIYGNSNTVQPPSVTMQYIIKC